LAQQHQFFEKYKDIFEEIDENKFEYTSVFDEYFKIMDEVIERGLRDQFSKDEVMSFYANFAQNIQMYRELKPESVDKLFGFCDFTQFKANMLNYKNEIEQAKLESEALLG